MWRPHVPSWHQGTCEGEGCLGQVDFPSEQVLTFDFHLHNGQHCKLNFFTKKFLVDGQTK